MLNARQRAYLNVMGIDVWQCTDAPLHDDTSHMQSLQEAIPDTPVEVKQVDSGDASTIRENPLDTELAQLDWDALAKHVSACQRCALHQTRIQTVFGVGNHRARLMIIGEAPGADEDRQGEPFVGKAGQLLNAMLKAIGFARQDVYIANILKCHPPQNRDPSPEEATQCGSYLYRQIQLVQPDLILAVGRIAAQRLLKNNMSLARLRGRLHALEDIAMPVVVTYHPAYLLRTPSDKRKAWEDLLFAMQVLQEQERKA